MSTFSPKRPDSRTKERYSPTGPNVTFTRSGKPEELPGTAVYGIQEIPVKKPLKTEFEKKQTGLNEKNSKVRLGKNCARKEKMEANRPSPIAMNPLNPTKITRDTPTFRSSPDNPLSHGGSGKKSDRGSSLRSSQRFAARLKFEASHTNNEATPDENRFAGQKEAHHHVQETKTKETFVLKEHPHGATQARIHHSRHEGMSLPGLGFGSTRCLT